MPQRLNQQPCGVAARPCCGRQGFLRRLNARFHPDYITNPTLQLSIESNEVTYGVVSLPRNGFQVLGEQRSRLDRLQIRCELGLQTLGIDKGKAVGVRLNKEIERVDHGHLRREIDLDLEFVDLLREDIARQPIALRVLLPVHEMVGGRDLERIAQHRRPGMWCGAETYRLGAQLDRTIIFVVGDVM